MATRCFTRLLLTSTRQTLTSIFSTRSFTSLSLSRPPPSLSSTFSLFRLRPLVAVSMSQTSVASSVRCFATRRTASSLNDPQPNWSNRPPKETILLDGCDFEHWLIVVEKPEGDPTRDEIIDSYIKTLATVVGSEEEARMKIYSVSTRCYYAFGALVSEELSYKLKELPHVRWVLPDSYLDVKNKDYGGEPFINGQAVPYDPKYHAEWERNNARAHDRNRRNDRPRNHDRSRNYDRRMQMANQSGGGNMGQRGPGGPQNAGPGGPHNMGPTNSYVPPNTVGVAPNRDGMAPPNNFGGMPSHNIGGPASNYMGQQPSNQMGQQPSNRMGGQDPSNYMAGQPSSNYGGGSQHNMGGVANPAQNFQYENASSGGGAPYQSGPVPNQNNYAPNMAGGNPYQNQNIPGRDISPPQNYQ